MPRQRKRVGNGQGGTKLGGTKRTRLDRSRKGRKADQQNEDISQQENREAAPAENESVSSHSEVERDEAQEEPAEEMVVNKSTSDDEGTEKIVESGEDEDGIDDAKEVTLAAGGNTGGNRPEVVYASVTLEGTRKDEDTAEKLKRQEYELTVVQKSQIAGIWAGKLFHKHKFITNEMMRTEKGDKWVNEAFEMLRIDTEEERKKKRKAVENLIKAKFNRCKDYFVDCIKQAVLEENSKLCHWEG